MVSIPRLCTKDEVLSMNLRHLVASLHETRFPFCRGLPFMLVVLAVIPFTTLLDHRNLPGWISPDASVPSVSLDISLPCSQEFVSRVAQAS